MEETERMFQYNLKNRIQVESLLELGNRSSLINAVNETTATVTIETEADETHKRSRCYNFLRRSPEFKYFTDMVIMPSG